MISNCDLHVYVRGVLDLPEDASNEALVDAVNNLYVQYRDLKDELGVPYWADHKEVLDEAKSLFSSRDRYEELTRALGLPPESDHSEVLAYAKNLASYRRIVNRTVLYATEAQGLRNLLRETEESRDSWRQKAEHARASVLHKDLCEALGLDPEVPDQQIVDQAVLHATAVRGLRDLEKSRDFWRQKAAHLQGVINRAKEALED